jgi:hypothetical protein
MKIVSFDIGIKNMAYCIFDISKSPDSWEVVDWNVIDLMEAPTTTDDHISGVCGCLLGTTKKKGVAKTCGKKAKYYYKTNTTNTIATVTNYFCEKHAKSQTEYLLPSKEYTLAHLRKQKVEDIAELFVRSQELQRSVITYEGNPSTVFPRAKLPNKNEMMDSIMKYYSSRLFSEIPIVKKNANDANLIQIGWAIRRELESSVHFANVAYAVIENQISPIATRMKTIQGMLAQYFIMKSTLEHPIEIVFVSSSNKLRLGKNTTNEATKSEATGGKSEATGSKSETKGGQKYKQNKKDGVTLCSRYIDANQALTKWSGSMKVTKKDDLADCFLQGVWFMSNRNIITCAENLKINIV